MSRRKPTPDEVIARFWSKVERQSDGCWPWMGTRFDSGYGGFLMGGKLRRAHRVMWELTGGLIPDGMFVLHRCDNPPCVNPAHLFLGTPQDNMTDKVNKGRLVASPGERNGMWGKRKAACKHGHELTGDNVYLNRGQRHCRVCRHERITVWNARVRAERSASRGEKTESRAS